MYYETYTVIINSAVLYYSAFVSAAHSHPSLIFEVRARGLPTKWCPDSDSTRVDSPAFLANIRLSWRGLPSTNTILYKNGRP